MAVELKIGSAETDESEATKKPQDTVNLVARRSLNGDIMIFDHEDIDIVVMPDKNKIVTFPKDLMEDKVYSSQDRLFYFLRKNGVIEPESVQGGNIYGSIEAAIASPLEENVSSVQVAVRTISKFIEEEKPYFRTYQEFEEDYDERIVDPDAMDSTELGEVPHEKEKGSLRHGYTRGPYGMSTYYRYEE